MSLSLAFWIVMFLWALGIVGAFYYPDGPKWVGSVLTFLLFLMLGVAVFGGPIK